MRTVLFAGYSWSVKRSDEAVGPGPNLFSDRPENVWVDEDHRLHLGVTDRRRWLCAEVVIAPTLGTAPIASPSTRR